MHIYRENYDLVNVEDRLSIFVLYDTYVTTKREKKKKKKRKRKTETAVLCMLSMLGTLITRFREVKKNREKIQEQKYY